jgi:hypothetical protein
MWAAGIERIEEEERGTGNAGRGASPTAGKREGFFLLISCLIRLIHLLSLYREEVLLNP